ncbi:MAG: SAM-dependent methyltransferase [Bauldia sp.]|nr:SAM-dependent methyltransferase [Bauldia sp.]
MAVCLGDPEHGYYTTREPFGQGGDFITSPEISQIFGELIGLWAVATWEAMGSPARFVLAELGPGRGTLMADALRAARVRPQFLAAATVALVEISPRLRVAQAEAIAPLGIEPVWRDRVDDLPGGPLIVIANEFFDALPVRQIVRTADGWAERMVGLGEKGDLVFGLRPVTSPAPHPNPLPAGGERGGTTADDALPEGSIVELRPAADAIVATLAARIARDGGAALLIDYGYAEPGAGDTLQALYRQLYDSALSHPGEADLTAHVDFAALARGATTAGAVAYPVTTQGEFLGLLGIADRVRALAAGKSAEEQQAIGVAAHRLVHPDAMGSLFKVLAIGAPGLALPGFET